MSILTLQIGQCGNQLGPVFFDILAQEYSSASGSFYEDVPWNPFFRVSSDKCPKAIARSLLIDMEPSVVRSALATSQSRKSKWRYSQDCCFMGQSGSGNNWAMGYQQHGPTNEDKIVNMVQKELEKCDFFGGFLMMHSLAGGTGSGLGAYLTTILSDHYSTSYLLNFCIWPFSVGEVIVQNYNALLTLSSIADSSHAIIMLDNNTLAATSQSILQKKQASFRHMNQMATQSLASWMLPSKVRSVEGQATMNDYAPGDWTRMVSDILHVLCPTNKQKLLTCAVQPQMTQAQERYGVPKWKILLQKTKPSFLSYKSKQVGTMKCIANYLTLRGRDSLSTNVTLSPQNENYVNRVSRIGVSYSPVGFMNHSHSLSVLTNHQSNIVPVTTSLSQAKKMFKTKAFLHNYAAYGLSTENFMHAFETIENDLIAPYAS